MNRIKELCIEEHAFPANCVWFAPLSEEEPPETMPETPSSPHEAISEEEDGTWSLNLNFRIDTDNRPGGFLVCRLRPLVRFSGDAIFLETKGDAASVEYGDLPEEQEVTIKRFTREILKELEGLIDLFKPEGNSRARVIGFSAN